MHTHTHILHTYIRTYILYIICIYSYRLFYCSTYIYTYTYIHTYIHIYIAKGSFGGLWVTLTVSYFLYIDAHIHLYMRALLCLCWLAVMYVVHLFRKTRPMTSKCENLTSLAAKIIQSSPQEGSLSVFKEFSSLH